LASSGAGGSAARVGGGPHDEGRLPDRVRPGGNAAVAGFRRRVRGPGDDVIRTQVPERLEDEAAPAELGVGKRQARVSPDDVAVQREVDVDDAGAPALAPNAAELELDPLRRVEQVQRREIGVDLDRGVEEVGLILGTDRLRNVQTGAPPDPDAGAPIEPGHRGVELRLGVAQVGAQRQVRENHAPVMRGLLLLAKPRTPPLHGGMSAEPDVEGLTRALMEIPSTTNEEGPVCAFVQRALTEQGWTVRTQAVPPDPGVERAPGRMNVLATTGDRPRVVLTTHLDTVPPYIPYSDDADWIYGRGACDAKGVFAAMWVAAARLRRAGRPVGLLAVVGEETDSLGAKMVHELLPDTDWIIDGEPTEGVMASGAKGILSLRLSVRGAAAHSAYPERGDSALHRLIPALAALLDAELPFEPDYGPTTVNVGRLEGGVAPNVLAPSASAQVLIRLGAAAERVEREVRALLPPEVQVEELSRSDPHPIDVVEGQPSAVVRFGSDVPYLRRIGRPLLVGPGSIHDAHTRHERIRRQDLRDAVDQYVLVAEALLRTEPGR